MRVDHVYSALILGFAECMHAQGSINEWAPGGPDDCITFQCGTSPCVDTNLVKFAGHAL